MQLSSRRRRWKPQGSVLWGFVGFGDEIIAAGQAQHYYDTREERSVIVDLHGRPRWHPIWEGNPAIMRPTEKILPGDRRILNAPNARPYIVYPFTAESGWTFNQDFHCRDYVAKIHLTAPERSRGHYMRARYGPYVLIEPWSKHANLTWPLDHWQQLIDARPKITFVQHTHDQSPTLRGVHREPATFREACGLVASARCYIRGESGMCHAAAALAAQQIPIGGGCMDWDVMGGYPGQVGVGVTPPFCGRYLPCDHCRATMAAITVETVLAALDQMGVA